MATTTTGYYNNMPADLAQWYNSYSGALQAGKADTSQYNRYLQLSKQYGLKQHTIGQDVLKDLSIKALSGDKTAADYLKATNQKYLSGSALWDGITPDQLNSNVNLRWAYMKDNPTADYTKNYDYGQYQNIYNKKIMNGQPLSDWERNWYNDMIQKWGLEDYNDPYVQQRAVFQKDKQDALNSQDIALNQGLASQDAQNFQMYQQLAQAAANKGITGSGMASDAYMRATMGANQNYQQAYAQAAQNKSDIASQYDQAITGSKINQQQYQDQLTQQQQQAQIDLMKLQNDQDQFLTQQTGYVYIGGHMVTDSKGNPMKTLDYLKLDETTRHNIAQEALTSQKNTNDYNLGMQKVAVDLQKAIMSNNISQAQLDYKYAALDAQNAYRQDQIEIAKKNATTSAEKARLSSLQSQANNLVKQITAYQKKKSLSSSDKKAMSKLIDKLNETNNAIDKIVQKGFNSSSKGGGSVDKVVASVKAPASFKGDLASAMKAEGVSGSTWANVITSIVQRESSFNYKAKNPTSSAYGYAQFLSSTRANYEKKMGLSYSIPANQLRMMIQYIKDRYKTPEAALAFWNKNHWY